MRKRYLAFILFVCVLVVLGTPIAQASTFTDDRVSEQTRWTNTATILLAMSYSNGTITSEGQIVGKAGTTKISVSFTLEKLVSGKYQYVDSWSASNNSMYCTSSHKTYNCSTGTYKLSLSGTVTKDNYAEPVESWLIKTF